MPKVKPSLYKGPKRKATAAEKELKRQNKKMNEELRNNYISSIKELDKRIRASKKAEKEVEKVVGAVINSNDFQCDDDWVDYACDYDDVVAHASGAKRRTINDLWKMHGKTLVEWYIESMAKGEPHLLSVNLKQDKPACSCNLSFKKITLYMVGCKF